MGAYCTKQKDHKADLASTIKAALLIQRWYRRYLARMEVRRRYTWTIFQNIEYAGEQDQVRLYDFFNALLTHIPTEAATRSLESQQTSRASSNDRLDSSKYSDESDDLADEGIKGPENVYRGPHLNFPLQKKDIYTLIDLFRKKKSNRLHAKYVAGILREATNGLKRLPNFNLASTAVSKQITICGDLHGKLDDLLVVFHKNGLPSEDNPYVFNGDFVDRGKKGLEVFLLLLSCFLAFPGGVHLNRGNHEDSVMNGRYGFINELRLKYRKNSERLLKLIEEVYRWLPLGTIINNRVLVVHGGISDTTDLDLMKSIDRGKYISILRPPIFNDESSGRDNIDKTEWKQVFDVMWSDPQHAHGCIPNSLRGAGTYFGPDVSKDFLAKYKLDFLVRSHECKVDGHEVIHDGKVITIFSASNYYAIGSNKGAYLKLNPQLDTHFVLYTAAASKTRRLTFRQRVGLIESSALQELGARLRSRRIELEKEFKKRDPNGTGIITLSQWCEAMEAATHLGLPWRLLREKLAPVTQGVPATQVNYRQTLQLLDTDSVKHAYAGTTSVVESLYSNKSSLEALFRILDKDNSGYISLEEFSEAIDLLQRHMPEYEQVSKEELMEMCKMMDINSDGKVDLNEFLEAFRLCEKATHKVTSTHQISDTQTPNGKAGNDLQRITNLRNLTIKSNENQSKESEKKELNTSNKDQKKQKAKEIIRKEMGKTSENAKEDSSSVDDTNYADFEVFSKESAGKEKKRYQVSPRKRRRYRYNENDHTFYNNDDDDYDTGGYNDNDRYNYDDNDFYYDFDNYNRNDDNDSRENNRYLDSNRYRDNNRYRASNRYRDSDRYRDNNRYRDSDLYRDGDRYRNNNNNDDDNRYGTDDFYTNDDRFYDDDRYDNFDNYDNYDYNYNDYYDNNRDSNNRGYYNNYNYDDNDTNDHHNHNNRYYTYDNNDDYDDDFYNNFYNYYFGNNVNPDNENNDSDYDDRNDSRNYINNNNNR